MDLPVIEHPRLGQVVDNAILLHLSYLFLHIIDRTTMAYLLHLQARVDTNLHFVVEVVGALSLACIAQKILGTVQFHPVQLPAYLQQPLWPFRQLHLAFQPARVLAAPIP